MTDMTAAATIAGVLMSARQCDRHTNSRLRVAAPRVGVSNGTGLLQNGGAG
jgi:hypothetical protein